MARPTLVSLARELGVSRQTVSNVINAPHLVKTETRERVQAAIEASGYRPNVAAQALRNRRSMTLAMRMHPTLEDGINGAIRDRFLHHLVVAARAQGYSLLLTTADSFDDEVDVLTEMHVRGTIDGCVLTDTHAGDSRPSRLVANGVPVAAFGRPWGHDERHPWVDVEGWRGTHAATNHLLEAGHERIGFIGWPGNSDTGVDRRTGWERAMAEHGYGAETGRWQAERVDQIEQGMEAAEKLLDEGVEAFVCASDSLALGALEAVRRRGFEGLEAPVIGFDNTPVARAMGLSSLDQPVEQAAEVLCRQLVARIAASQDATGSVEDEHVLLEPTLVVRELAEMYAPVED
ncbi:LacI family DNA-binding transcriptional regulator [Luteococcus peritonei]|uniref:LacI family DNA-binding transcriptional regulator n=1 Tax=Luteococcus peritonei TaxID=88874 RepID=A0ABW4RY91_9ACTN